MAADLAERFPGVALLALDRKGRGLALREAWSRSTADVVAYMDVDLSTGLDALVPLLAPLLNGHSDIAIGSRLAPGAFTSGALLVLDALVPTALTLLEAFVLVAASVVGTVGRFLLLRGWVFGSSCARPSSSAGASPPRPTR